jgi:hypothetical protein
VKKIWLWLLLVPLLFFFSPVIIALLIAMAFAIYFLMYSVWFAGWVVLGIFIVWFMEFIK